MKSFNKLARSSFIIVRHSLNNISVAMKQVSDDTVEEEIGEAEGMIEVDCIYFPSISLNKSSDFFFSLIQGCVEVVLQLCCKGIRYIVSLLLLNTTDNINTIQSHVKYY